MKFTENIHVLPIQFKIRISSEIILPRFVNVILVFGDKITLIDTGVKGSENLIFDYLKKHNRNPEEIENLILSHSHPDHIGSAAAIKKQTNCSVYTHQLEKDWIEDIELQNRHRPVPGFISLVDTPVKVDQFITNGQILNQQNGIPMRIIEAPGHSPGSVNILFENEKVLFTADSIPLKNDIPNYDNYPKLMKSLGKIKSLAKRTIVLTSWTEPTSDNKKIDLLISEGEEYLKQIDRFVKETYQNRSNTSLNFCRLVVEKLGLPPYLVNPLIDKAFRSHLKS